MHSALTRNVHVWAVDIVPGWKVPAFLAIWTWRLLSGPGLVPPGKEDKSELVDNITVGDVEVVLEGGKVDPAVRIGLEMLLRGLEGVLAKLDTKLGCWVAHEVAV